LVPPGGRGAPEVLEGDWRCETSASGGGGEWRLATGWSLPGGDGAVMILQARGAWRCVMPVRRSEPSMCLAT